jgi:hypothetical protein
VYRQPFGSSHAWSPGLCIFWSAPYRDGESPGAIKKDTVPVVKSAMIIFGFAASGCDRGGRVISVWDAANTDAGNGLEQFLSQRKVGNPL